MSLIAEDRLVSLSLLALEESAEAAQRQPGTRTIALRTVLAFLASRHAVERWPDDQFWRALVDRDDIARRASLSATLTAIYSKTGRRRPLRPLDR